MLGIKLATQRIEVDAMETLVITTTLAGSLAAAFVLQKAILEAWLRAMNPERSVAKR